ncbi:MAG: methylated-DNA--[protein]-cysteine S-methyltransferase [Propionibacteriaceae bacterium]|nr:methylated-DNA--[protein]-cysteine S-methyltransferase [Propionibacteriaceae bacterium]
MNRHRVWKSPVGELTVVIDPQGRLAGVYLEGQKHWPAPEVLGERDDSAGADVVAQLADYFAGRRVAFDIEFAPRGTEFQESVWAALRAIPYGRTSSYGELAEMIGRPAASRAVGAATGRNPWSIVVPCHRLVGRGGALTGYAGGIAVKERLLAMERGQAAIS